MCFSNDNFCHKSCFLIFISNRVPQRSTEHSPFQLNWESVLSHAPIQACTGAATGLAQTMVSLQKKLLPLLVVIPAHSGGIVTDLEQTLST